MTNELTLIFQLSQSILITDFALLPNIVTMHPWPWQLSVNTLPLVQDTLSLFNLENSV